MQLLETTQDIIEASLKSELYQNLIFQLNKDFRFANVYFEVDNTITPKLLINQLHDTVFKLIQSNFSAYLNLLYIVDVSEKQVKKLDGSDTLNLSKNITYLILKREWQKVWFRHQYS